MRGPSKALPDERSRAVLRVAVETYIRSASPVASKALNRTSLPISSAAIRAVMASLEGYGLLIKPHISAGRMPTQRGYRTYVDRVMALGEVPREKRERVRRILSQESDTRRLMRACVRTLIDATGLTGFAVSAPQSAYRHRHVEFVRLRPGEVLAIFATQSGGVLHRHVGLEVDVSQRELDRFQNFLNARFDGMTFAQMRALIAQELDGDKTKYLSSRAFQLSARILPGEDERPLDVVVAGQHRLLTHPEFADAARASPVLEEFERNQTWRHLLEVALEAGGIAVMIGDENDVAGLRECAVVTASVPWEEGVDGALGLVGPTRLAYSTVISLLDYVREYVLSNWMRRRYSA